MTSQEPTPDDPCHADEAEFEKWLDAMGIRWREMSPESCAARHSHRCILFLPEMHSVQSG
jgi:hypothetical protein